MNKCSINDQSLQEIRKQSIKIIYSYKKHGKSTVDLQQDMIGLFKSLPDQYELAQVDSIASEIHQVAISKKVEQLLPDFFSVQNIINLITAYRDNIQVNNFIEASTEQITDSEQIRNKLDVSRAFLDDAYGIAREVRSYMERQTNQSLFECCFINRNSPEWRIGIVRNNCELNNNIRKYQERLLQKITAYLWDIIKNSRDVPHNIREIIKNPQMYDEKNNYTEVLQTLNSLINSYLGVINADQLSELYNKMNDSTISQIEREKAKLRLEAYNAKVLLYNFDTYLSLLLGRNIQIKDFNDKTGEDKYQITGKSAKLLTSWRVSEDINVEEEVDSITKLAIQTTPLMRWQSDTPINGEYLNFSDFQHIIAKIKDLAYNEQAASIVFDRNFRLNKKVLWNSLDKNTQEVLRDKSFLSILGNIRENPRKYIHVIFDLLSKSQMKSSYTDIYSKFTSNELNRLYSLSKGIFNGDNSLRILSKGQSNIDYYSYITQVADSIFNVKYLQYYRDTDGIVRVRTLVDQEIANIKRSIEQSINYSNNKNTIKNWEDFKDYYKIDPKYNNGVLTTVNFNIPNTDISVTVFVNSGTVSAYKNGVKLDFVENYKALLPFIDDKLRLNIKNNSVLQEELIEKYGSLSSLSEELFGFASRVLVNQYVSNEILKDSSIESKEAMIKSIYGNNPPKYNYTLDEIGLVHGNDVRQLQQLSIAIANFQGITTSTQVKDGDGNQQSQQTLSRLLGSLQSQFELLEKQEDSVTKDFILLNTPGLFEGVVTVKEFSDQIEGTKPTTSMSSGEMAYSQIVYDFIGGLAKDKRVSFLPSVNSDKKTIGRILINIAKNITITNQVEGIINKPLSDYTSEELELLINRELGTTYSKIYENIINTWSLVDMLLVKEGIKEAPSLAHDFSLDFVYFNKWWLEKGSHTEIINGEEIRVGNTHREKSPVELIKYVVSKFNKDNRLHPIELIDQMHFKNNKGNLAINKSLIAQIVRFNPKHQLFEQQPQLLYAYPSAQQFWRVKKSEILKSLLRDNFIINTSNTQQAELKYIRDNYRDWINTSGNVILAKAIIDGVQVDITSNRDLIKLGYKDIESLVDSFSESMTLNPILEQYNYLDYLFTQEFMLSTVGTFIAHKEKSKSSDVLEQEAAHFQAQHKRNVSFTATMQEFQLNLLNGIPRQYNIAVIEDIEDELGTIIGLVNTVKPFDGATFVNPFVVILENNSLGGAKAGITKKQFVHFKSHTTGSGGIIKTAGFGLTNDWIRNSPFLQIMMKKMTNHIWLNEDGSPATVDITKSYLGNKINYNDFYFKREDKYYKITHIENLGNNRYRRTIQEVDINGNLKENTSVTENEVVINTNYQLWNFFGGKDSMSIKNETLQYSNASVENVVTAMNSTAGYNIDGSIITRNGKLVNEIDNQDDLWQPLKQVDVHYLATAGAVKQGGTNINSAAKYLNDEDYDIQRVYMYQAGIQLDKEHHADQSELSLMTQVMSACAAKGYTIDQAIKLYNAFRSSTEYRAKEYLDAIKALFNDGTEQSLDTFTGLIIESVLKALSNPTNKSSFASIIATDLIKQAREGKNIKFSEVLLPLSDNTIYAKVLSSISSYLTNTGIKQSIPGLLSVLTPSYNIFRLYGNRKYESFTNPQQELEELQREEAPVFDSEYQWTQGQENFAGLQLVYVNPGELVSQVDGQPVAMRNPHDGRVLIDMELMRAKFEQKTWRNTRNSEPLDYDFKSFDEWMRFALLHEAMYNTYLIKEGESRFDYETRVNKQALKRLQNDISNLELGREYFVTRNVMTEVEDMDGNIIQVPVPVTQSELIRTPSEYYKLKQDILNGKVTTVIENITVGRDLAGYNVRFSSTTGERFQLWDLDSANYLFSINELKENWSGSIDNIESLKEIYRGVWGKELDITKGSPESYLELTEKVVRRILQNDLMNLSLSSDDVINQYNKLLEGRQDTREWYDKYAQWVNITFRRSNGSAISINGQLTTVNSDNFNEVSNYVLRILENSKQVKIGGKYYNVDKSSIKTQAYELIMPKTFATAFGLKEFDDLNTIVNDKDFFIKQYVKNQATLVLPKQYSIEFKSSSGNHIYVLNKNLLSNSELNRKKGILTLVQDGKTYRLDSDRNIMYEITPDTEIWTDKQGNEVIVSDDIDFYMNSLSYDSIKLSNRLLTRPSILKSILESLQKSPNKIATRFYKQITINGTDSTNILRENNYLHSATLDNYQEALQDSPIIKQCREKHTSFLKSLDIIAARIPAQSMQSFMPMRVVAFDNPDINTAYVSTYQILLQGSDYKFIYYEK